VLGEPLKNIFVIVDAQNSLALTSRVTLQIHIDIVTMPASRNRSTIAHSFGV